ncbi:MAG: conjugal transfer protein TraF [Capsulimonadales bacterium]|nr:conjugal transfer protein TraF [Capsulimonadales bacterium]
MKSPRFSRRVFSVAALTALAAVGSVPALAQSDITFGGDARAFAMGGAGIALQNLSGANRINPATLAFEVRRFDLIAPSIAVRTENDLSVSRVYDYFFTGRLKDGGDLNDIVRTFSGKDSVFGVNGSAGIRVGSVEVSGFAVGKGRLLINNDLRNWIESGRPGEGSSTAIRDNAPNSRADVIAAGYYNLPAIGVGVRLPMPESARQHVAVGVRVKVMRAYYAHYLADAAVLDAAADAFAAPELRGRDYLDKRGVGADLGFLWRQTPRPAGVFSAGLVVANVVNPRFKFSGTDRNGAPTTVDLLKTTASLGAGYQWKGLTAAADLVDVTGGGDSRQFRTGAEYAFGRNLALRGGYSSAGGFTYGGGLFGFNVAFGQRQPLEVVRTINF